MHGSVFSMPHEHRPMLKATEAVLTAIYEAAYAGLHGDTIAFAADLLPSEYRELEVMDDRVELAVLKGRADSEMRAATVINDAIDGGDAKMALEKLKHQHDWFATTKVDMNVTQEISILAALELAETKVLEANREFPREIEHKKPLKTAKP